MSDSVLKKEFQKRDVDRLRNLVKGKYGDRTTVGIGYSKTPEGEHKEGDIWKGDEKSTEPRKLLKVAVQGGTGYAVEMAIQAGKPVYVFDQVRNQWYKNII